MTPEERAHFEAALRISNPTNSQGAQEKVKPVHHQVPQFAPLSVVSPLSNWCHWISTHLYDGLALDQMSSTSHHNPLAFLIHHLIHRGQQEVQVGEPGGAVGVSEEDEATAGMAYTLR
jgi:hypothetical protein